VNLLPEPRFVTIDDDVEAFLGDPEVRRDSSLPPQGYRLVVRQSGVILSAADPAGEFYGRATLEQLRRVYGGGRGQAMTIEDWPDLAVRGVMLDLSRDKVPTMETLKALVDRLAGWKVNHLELYLEHTFAYPNHREVWQHASPITPDEITELQAFCKERFIELSANRNCLGHMERWLKFPTYRSLAYAPDGFVDRWGRKREPTTLDPGRPESLALVRDLLAQLVPLFDSKRVNVGLDEPWELADDKRGDDYLDFLSALRQVPELDGREMLVWGDILADFPELIERLPDGVTVCEWGYEADHPFDARTTQLAKAGRPFWVCPGTSSWMSIVGRVSNARGNNIAAAEAARAHGGEGYLNTDWGDMGHLQYLPFSEPGLALGAAMSWCLDANRFIDVAGALDVQVYGDSAGVIGRALETLGDAHLGVQAQVPNSSILTFPLYYPRYQLGTGLTAGLTSPDLRAVEETVLAAADSLGGARLDRSDAPLVLDEIRAGAELIALLCRDGAARLEGDGTLASVAPETRQTFATVLADLIDRHRQLWRARNRPGGLDDSVARLERLHRHYSG
jgi:hexosaminidase